jgi:hypothetical protein
LKVFAGLSEGETRMRVFLRPLTLAAAFTVIGAVGVATAQTVVVTKAPPGATLELVLNAATIGTAKAGADGIGTIPLNLSEHGGKSEIDARIFVDVCEMSRRVMLLESGFEPPAPGANCSRRPIFGVFLVRGVTTLVVEAAEAAPAVWIRQGPAPASWLNPELASASGKSVPEFLLPKGLVLFGGGGIAMYGNIVGVACGVGTVACTGSGRRPALRVGGDYWFAPFLAVSASYLKPMNATADGSGSNDRFNTSLAPHVATLTGKVAIPAGRFRIYAEGGATYHRATFSTTETIDDQIITVDGVTQTITGGTQTFEWKTDGWGWVLGGGVEAWISRSLAIFGEAGRARLKGSAVGGGEGVLDETLTYVVGGIRLRIGR